MTNTLFPTTLLLTAALCSLNACERHDSAGKSGPSPMLASLTESAPAANPAAEAPASNEQSDRLWAMRKKVQQRGKQRTGTYLEQLQGCLSDGDLEGAEAALKSAIAQGTLSQSQIDEAKGRIASAYSSQQAKLVAEARAKEEASRAEAARATELAQAESQQQQRMARNDVPSRSGSESASTSKPDAGKSAKPAQSSEVDRFTAKFKGGYSTFTCTRDTNAGKGHTNAWITLKDGASGKEWAIYYHSPQFLSENRGDTGGLTLKDESLVGEKLEVRFNSKGEPESIKNLSNGNHCPVNDWKVSGYGW